MNIGRIDNRRIDDAVQRFDEHEWQVQERALREERDGTPPGDEPALAPYRQIARALRRPLPQALPDDFAQRVAELAMRRAHSDSRLEQVLTQLLLAALALAGVVAVMTYGGDWLRASADLLPPQAITLGLQWGLAIAGCLGLSWTMEQFRRRAGEHRTLH